MGELRVLPSLFPDRDAANSEYVRSVAIGDLISKYRPVSRNLTSFWPLVMFFGRVFSSGLKRTALYKKWEYAELGFVSVRPFSIGHH